VGQPNWNELFVEILAKGIKNKRKDIEVFFCGPQSMGEVVKADCMKHKLKLHKEHLNLLLAY
jgi:predicted ferric reductase